MQRQYDRWATTRDNLENGATLEPEQERLLSELAQSNPLCRLESSVFEELANFDAGALDDEDRAAADRVLASLQSRQDNTVVPLRPGTAPPARTDQAQTRAEGRSRTAWFVTALSAAALALGYVGARTLGSDEAPSTATINTATIPGVAEPSGWRVVLSSGGARAAGAPVQAGQIFPFGTSLLSDQGRTCMVLDAVATACLDARSEVRLAQPDGGHSRLEVVRGRVVVDVQKQPVNSSFSLTHGGLRARAIGTVYGLEVEPDGGSLVAVLDGQVEVTGGQSGATLAPSQQLRPSSAGANALLIDPRRAQHYRELLLGQASWDSGTVVVHVESQPTGADVQLDEESVGTSPMSVLTPVGAHTLSLSLEGHAPANRQFRLEQGESNRFLPFLLDPVAAAPDDRGNATNPTRTAKPSEPASPAQLLEQARELVSAGQWSSAANSYRSLRQTHPASPEAKTVLVALGQLQLDRLGQPAAAKRSFAAYLSTGGGALSQEARYGKIRALRKLGAKAAEAAAIREYLGKHPAGIDAATLRKRANELESTAKSQR